VRLQHRQILRCLISSLRSGLPRVGSPLPLNARVGPDRSGAIALDPLAALIDGVGVGVGVKQD
jgi:hypothetical protein